MHICYLPGKGACISFPWTTNSMIHANIWFEGMHKNEYDVKKKNYDKMGNPVRRFEKCPTKNE